MTDAEIERLALAAGCFTPGASRNYWAITDQMLRRFAALAQEVERNNADNLRQQVEDQAAEIERLRDELQMCCELKRTYQEQAAAEVCGTHEKQMHEVRVTAQPIDSAPCAHVPVHPRLGRLWANVRPAGAETPVPRYRLDDLYDKAAIDAAAVATYCLSLPGARSDFKWGGVQVFSIAQNKMFALLDLHGSGNLAFKVDADLFLGYCDRPGMRPAPYLARAHWISLSPPYQVSPDELQQLLLRSHQLVVSRLPKIRQVGLLVDN